MFKPQDQENLQDLYEGFSVLETPEEVAKFMQDLCTPRELVAIAQRYQIAKLLAEDCRYAEIVAKTEKKKETISRVNRSLSMVTYGGYAIVFDRLKAKKKKKHGADKK